MQVIGACSLCHGDVVRSSNGRVFCQGCGARPQRPTIQMEPAPPKLDEQTMAAILAGLRKAEPAPRVKHKLHCGPPVRGFDPSKVQAHDHTAGVPWGTPTC